MTVGVGFLCADGVMLCADDQITWRESHKYYERKIYPVYDSKASVVAATFSGNPDLMKSFVGKFKASMGHMPEPHTADRIQETIETVLTFFDVLKDEPTQLNLLCGIVIPNKEFRLVKSDGYVVRDVPRFDYVGIGDSSVLRFLSPLLVRRREFFLQEAFNIAAYMVFQAKRYVDGCGGSTDGLLMEKTGCGVNIHLQPGMGIEAAFSRIEHTLAEVANALSDTGMSDDRLDNYVKQFADTLKADATWFRRK